MATSILGIGRKSGDSIWIRVRYFLGNKNLLTLVEREDFERFIDSGIESIMSASNPFSFGILQLEPYFRVKYSYGGFGT